MLDLLTIVLGCVLLTKGADLLVEGACSLARGLNVSDLVIGLTIVALGTSAPELVVSVMSAVRGQGGIALGNVMGSNIANVCLVLGVAGCLRPVALRRGVVWREIPFCLGMAVLMMLVVLPTAGLTRVSRPEGAVLLLALAAYLVYMFKTAETPPARTRAPGFAARRNARGVALALLGLTGLLVGGELIVRAAVRLATGFGVSQEMVGLTVVALGTSLPELATAVVSVLKGKIEVAVGNVVGSNIANTGLVLGSSAALRPTTVQAAMVPDAAVLVVGSSLLFVAMFTGRRLRIDRWEALLFLALYAGYLTFTVLRG